MEYYETSAKTGAGVSEMFLALADNIRMRRVGDGVRGGSTTRDSESEESERHQQVRGS